MTFEMTTYNPLPFPPPITPNALPDSYSPQPFPFSIFLFFPFPSPFTRSLFPLPSPSPIPLQTPLPLFGNMLVVQHGIVPLGDHATLQIMGNQRKGKYWFQVQGAFTWHGARAVECGFARRGVALHEMLFLARLGVA